MFAFLSIRTIIAMVALAIMIMSGAPTAQAGDVHVRGYTRSNGTYVEPHVRSAPDGIVENNYSYGR